MKQWRRYSLLTAIGGGVVVIACTIWSLRPLRGSEISTLPKFEPAAPTVSNDIENHSHAETRAFDSNVFAVTLWHAPPKEQVAEVPHTIETPRKAEPLKVQLVAIIQEDGLRWAALYDMLDDRIVLIADGGVMRDRAVHVSDKDVEFSTDDGRDNQRLLLRPDETMRPKVGAAGSTQS